MKECSNCHHFVRTHNHRGQCHRMPPQAVGQIKKMIEKEEPISGSVCTTKVYHFEHETIFVQPDIPESYVCGEHDSTR